MVCSNTRLLSSVFGAIWAPINYLLVNVSTVPVGFLKFAVGALLLLQILMPLILNMDFFRDPINSTLSSL